MSPYAQGSQGQGAGMSAAAQRLKRVWRPHGSMHFQRQAILKKPRFPEIATESGHFGAKLALTTSGKSTSPERGLRVFSESELIEPGELLYRWTVPFSAPIFVWPAPAIRSNDSVCEWKSWRRTFFLSVKAHLSRSNEFYPIEGEFHSTVLQSASQASITEQQDRCNSLALELQRKSQHVEDWGSGIRECLKTSETFDFWSDAKAINGAAEWCYGTDAKVTRTVPLVVTCRDSCVHLASPSLSELFYECLCTAWVQILEQHIRQIRSQPAVASGNDCKMLQH